MKNITNEQLNTIIDLVENRFKLEHKKLLPIYEKNGEGAARHAAGMLTEYVFEELIDSLNNILNLSFVSKVGNKDYLTLKIEIENMKSEISNLQVDRHIFLNNKRFAFVENKTYLDACYYDRALSDFEKIILSLKNDNSLKEIKFIVFSGQDAIDENKRKFLDCLFEYKLSMMNLPKPKYDVFYYLVEKKRSSENPIYKCNFNIDRNEIKRLILFMLN